MSAYPVPVLIPWTCSCRTIHTPSDLSDSTCNRCGAVYASTADAPAVSLVNPAPDERPVTPPKPPPRAQQHGSIPGIDLREMLYRSGLRGSGLVVALGLYDHRAPGSWTANISQEKLAASVSRGVRTVERTLDHLHDKGIILSQQKRRKRGGGYFLEYRLRPFMPEGGRASERPRMNEQPAAERSARAKSPQDPPLAEARPPQEAAPSSSLVSTRTGTCTSCQGTGWVPVVEGGERQGVRRCGCRGKSLQGAPRQNDGVHAPRQNGGYTPLTGG